jgi:hypothetical protein
LVTKCQRAVWQASLGYPRDAQQCYDDVIGNVPDRHESRSFAAGDTFLTLLNASMR